MQLLQRIKTIMNSYIYLCVYYNYSEYQWLGNYLTDLIFWAFVNQIKTIDQSINQ